jgi:hypothetical protein
MWRGVVCSAAVNRPQASEVFMGDWPHASIDPAIMLRNGVQMSMSSIARFGASAAIVVAMAGGVVAVQAVPAQAADPVETVAFQAVGTNERLVAIKVPNFEVATVKTAALAGSLASWDLFPSNGVSFVLKHRATKLCLDTNDGGSSTVVAGRTCDGTRSQDWNLDLVFGGSRMIRNGFTNQYLTKQAGSHTPNLRDFNGAANQQWTKTP